jgi:hypothetical protein
MSLTQIKNLTIYPRPQLAASGLTWTDDRQANHGSRVGFLCTIRLTTEMNRLLSRPLSKRRLGNSEKQGALTGTERAAQVGVALRPWSRDARWRSGSRAAGGRATYRANGISNGGEHGTPIAVCLRQNNRPNSLVVLCALVYPGLD